MTTEIFKRAFPVDKIVGQSPVLAIAILFLIYQERRETREAEASKAQVETIVTLQKENHEVLRDLSDAVREMSLSIARLEGQRNDQ